MNIFQTGTTDGIPWTIQVKMNKEGRYSALVTVGTTHRISEVPYTYEDEAEAVAALMLANMLEDLVEVA